MLSWANRFNICSFLDNHQYTSSYQTVECLVAAGAVQVFHPQKNILPHIQRGDCYEINFCQEFFATGASIDPPGVYAQLTAISPKPFSCFYKLDHRYLLCASPERYLQKKGCRLTSQPIKGTFKR